MLSQKLKTATILNHQILEKKIISGIRSVNTQEDYVKLINLFYSFFGGLEPLINNHLDLTTLPDYHLRRKSSYLAEDLNYLNAALPILAEFKALPEINNHFQALGALYVIEGSTLGGKIISKMIKKQLAFDNDNSLSFFNGYGDETNNMWHFFKQSMDLPSNMAHENVIIDSANDTFLRFSEWIDFQNYTALLKQT